MVKSSTDPLGSAPGDPEQFFEGHPFALDVYRRVGSTLDGCGPFDVRVTRSQVAFRRRRGFAYLWLPGRWLRNPAAEVVLSLAIPRLVESSRFKEVVHPSRAVWMHHLEVQALRDLDEEVASWLREAYAGSA